MKRLILFFFYKIANIANENYNGMKIVDEIEK